MEKVTSREGRVSRNVETLRPVGHAVVTSREGRVSRNVESAVEGDGLGGSRPARGV